jgi:SpoIID/LytB domain protein
LKALSVLVPAIVVGLVALPVLTGVARGATVPSTFSFAGSGWGHGVGLSQYGAYGQATEGRSAEQILRHYYKGSTVGAYRDDMNLRVNLAYQSTKVRLRVEAVSTGSPRLEVTTSGKTIKAGPKDILELKPSGRSIEVRKNGAVVASGTKIVVRWSGTRFPGSTGSTPAVLNLVKGDSSFTSSGHRYRYGQVEAVARTASGRTTLSVNTIVRLHDEYLYGIGEMPSSWPNAALQAQVVASRGYALTKYRQGIRSGCDCHVFSSTSDQVFAGWSKQSGPSGSRWTAAVRATNVSATASKTVLVKGAPVQTFFFSSSGGRTQNSEDVWSAKLSHLRSVDDHWSKNAKLNGNASWGPRVRSQAEVAKAFGLPNVVRLDLSTRYASGAVKTAKAWSSSGAVATVKGTTLVAKLSLASRWYWLVGAAASSATSPAVSPSRFIVKATAPAANQGSPSLIRGTALPAKYSAGHRISIKQWDPALRTWKYLGATRVAANGTYALKIRPSVRGTVPFLIYKQSESCGNGCRIGSSVRRVDVKVGPRFWVTPSVNPVQKAGRSVPVSGTVSPAKSAAGQSVSVKRYNPTTKAWVTITKAKVSAQGRFAVSLKPLPKGTTTLRVDLAGVGCGRQGCAVGAGWSKTLRVTVR